MDIQEFAIEGLKLIIPKRFSDARGYFQETWSDQLYRKALGEVDFVQDNLSLSLRKGTLRGLHFKSRPLPKVSWCGLGEDPSSMLLWMSEKDRQPTVSMRQ